MCFLTVGENPQVEGVILDSNCAKNHGKTTVIMYDSPNLIT